MKGAITALYGNALWDCITVIHEAWFLYKFTQKKSPVFTGPF
jgi:hypothetical protein